MPVTGGDDKDDEALFLEAMRGVSELDRSDRREPVSPPAARPRAAGQTPRGFTVDASADGVEGRGPGVNERVVADLRAGTRPIDRTVDLHGQRRQPAVDLVRRHVDIAVEAGQRCLLIVHGRGSHSGGAPVLRDAVVEALSSGATAKRVRAFCTARPQHGGAGAMYVLLAKS